MQVSLAPISGIIVGIILIIYRDWISSNLQTVFEKFPKYKDGVNAFNISFTVRPIFVTALGIVVITFSILSFLALIFN